MAWNFIAQQRSKHILDKCWIWQGKARNGKGYAQKGGGKGRIPVFVHRWMYEIFKGDIPEGLHIDHLCFVKDCVNPDHLEPVTQRENCLRWHRANNWAAKGNQERHKIRDRRPTFPRWWVKKTKKPRPIGPKNKVRSNEKLTPEQVDEIRATFKPGRGGGYRRFGKKYGVNYGTIRAIVTGKTWRERL